MKPHHPFIIAALASVLCGPLPAAEPPNPLINHSGFVALAKNLATTREENRISEERFLAMASEPGTVILDARSKDKYDNIHIKGAIHLAFTDFTEEALAKGSRTKPPAS